MAVTTKRRQLGRALRDWLVSPPEFILHDSVPRIRMLALALVLGEPLAWWLWAVVLEQPYESVLLRFSAMVLALPLAFRPVVTALPRKILERYWLVLCWFALPFSTLLLYRLNEFTHVWTAATVAMIYLLFQLTDWRLAMTGILVSLAGVALVDYILPNPELVIAFPMLDQLVVLGFALVSALGLAWSSSNMRKQRLDATLITVGVIAHELRTPLSSAALLTDALRTSGGDVEDRAQLLERLEAVFENMNALVDYQMANARLNNLPQQREVIDIGKLVESAVESYPWTSRSHRASVVVNAEQGLCASVHSGTLRQVIYNLLRNALTAIQATGRAPRPGDIEVQVTPASKGRGIRMRVIDKGIGIAASRMSSLFEPFQSTSATPSHGLGLIMCRNAITSFGGEIWCTSEEHIGTTFHIRLPLAPAGGSNPITIPAALRSLDPRRWD